MKTLKVIAIISIILLAGLVGYMAYDYVTDQQKNNKSSATPERTARDIGEAVGVTEDFSESASTSKDTDEAETFTAEGDDGASYLTTDGDIRYFDGFYIAGNAGYCNFGYYEPKAKSYAEAITKAADDLEGVANVYCIVVPEAQGIVLPEKYAEIIQPEDQGAAIEGTYSFMGDNVKTVNAYDSILAHKSEYLYFRTDHHWTQLAAYYTYKEFCKVAGKEIITLSERESITFDGYFGSLYGYSNNDPALTPADYVKAYYPLSKDYSMEVHYQDGTVGEWPVINDVTNYSYNNKYSTYVCGDKPLSIITNHEKNDGSACVLIKDSFGNCFAPFLVDYYEYVYIVDYRKYTDGLETLIKEKNIQDVIYLNPISLTQGDTATQLTDMLH